jgi:HisJ family histidinol phosphate phosphatase
MQDFDIHNHSEFSDGANSILEIAQFAQSFGLNMLGVSDHFYSIENNLDNYVEAVKSAQSMVNIKIMLGAEVDLPQQADMQKLEEIKKQYGFDFFIGALHGDKEKNIYVGDKTPTTQSIEFHQWYWNRVSELSNGLFDIIAHFDIINLSGMNYENQFEKEIDIAINNIKQSGQIVEINTKCNSMTCPSDYIIDRLAQKQIPLILSSDSHSKGNICNRFELEHARLINKFGNGLNFITTSQGILNHLHNSRT